METLNPIELRLIRSVEEIQLDTLETFPFWISTADMDTDLDYWPETEPNPDVELANDERWIQFPEDFSRQRLLFGDGDFDIWTPDWIGISQKHNGLLFIVEGFNDIESKYFEFDYPSVFVHLRFKSELDRMAAIKDIRKNIHEQYKEQIDSFHAVSPNLDATKHICKLQENQVFFFGQHPES